MSQNPSNKMSKKTLVDLGGAADTHPSPLNPIVQIIGWCHPLFRVGISCPGNPGSAAEIETVLLI